MKVKMRKFVIYLIIAISFTSCFQKDKALQPFIWKGQTFAFDQSMYTHQIYFDIESNAITKINNNTDWDLSFESSAKGLHIRVNSSNFLNIYPTGVYDFSVSQFQVDDKNWRYDISNGNSDSTAVGVWVNTAIQPYQYSGQVYLIGQYDGTSKKPFKKMIFSLVNDTSYKFSYADLNGDNRKDVLLRKDTSFNYTYFSVVTGKQVNIEPVRTNWDLLFTQYETTLFDNGKPLPYYVRGVLINPYGVQAAVDSSKTFEQITIADIPSFYFKTNWDAIGYNWKSVAIDIASNSARYRVRNNYNYIIRDVKGNFYKLRFVSFYSNTGNEGYPAFDFVKL
jgi:HmuY protein